MDRKRKKTLTGLQLKIMDVLWDRGEATVNEVQEILKHEKDFARSTVATMIARLEKQGLVWHRKVDITHIYYPVVDRNDVQKSMVSELVDSLFKGKSTELVNHLLDEDEYDREEIMKVIELIKKHEKGSGKDD